MVSPSSRARRSARKRRSATAVARGSCVAATRRISMGTGLDSPIGTTGPLLQRSQKLRLQAEGEVRNLVEQQRAPVRGAQVSGLLRSAPVNAPFL